MKKGNAVLAIVCLIISLSGCGDLLRKEITTHSHSTRSGVFLEVNENEAVQAGYGLVQISTSIKTRPEDYYLMNLGKSDVGKPGFPFVLNLDGQAIEWKIEGKQEATAQFENGKIIPDGGVGVRYVLKKTIRTKIGPHRVFVGLPRDNAIQEFDLTVKEGRSVLDFRPVYKAETMADIRSQNATEPSFVHGIRRLDIYYDGNKIKPVTDSILQKMFY